MIKNQPLYCNTTGEQHALENGLFINNSIQSSQVTGSTSKLIEFLNKDILRSEQFASFSGEHKDNLSSENII